jgi:uncharacterized protein DUF4331
MREPRRRARAASLASTLLILTFGLVPVTNAADHLDSPLVASNGATDITDVYAFSGPAGEATIFVVGINPGAGVLPNSGTTFGTKIDYLIKIDTNGDARPDIKYMYRFGKANAHGVQSFNVWRNGTWLARGMTGSDAELAGGGRTTAGLYDDPFFFDLDGFKGSVLGVDNGRALCDGDEVNFFLGLNLTAIILKVPNAALGGDGMTIGVYSTTQNRDGTILDQMGRPAINTVFNNVEMDQSDRQAFNESKPYHQVADGYRDHTEGVLTALGAADPEGLAAALIPDLLTYTTGDMSGFLNGRQLTDDVIDAELGLVTNGAVPSDCIDNDSDFRSHWPFLAPAN